MDSVFLFVSSLIAVTLYSGMYCLYVLYVIQYTIGDKAFARTTSDWVVFAFVIACHLRFQKRSPARLLIHSPRSHSRR